jgi:L-fuculose-phosphate aldolase
VLEAVRQRVAAAGRRLAAEGLVVASAGNVSERVDELVAITPTGSRLEAVTAEQIVIVELEGEQIEGDLVPTSELELHLAVYRSYHAGAIVHTHSPLATALSCLVDELPVIHYHLLLLGGALRVAPYATFGTRELAEVTVEALRDRGAALMANHGAIVHAPDLDSAVERALLLEWVCDVYWHAEMIGTPHVLDAEQQNAVVEVIAQRRYGVLQRRSPVSVQLPPGGPGPDPTGETGR